MADNKPAKPLALYPVYMAEVGTELPETGRYYVITKNGVYFRKETLVGSALVKVDGVPWLQEISSQVDLKLPKIPGRIIAQALTFFRKVWDKHQSEAYVTLLYSQKSNEYRLWCPKQTVTSGSVNYDRTDQPDFAERKEDNWQMVGTIHSHCNFSAFHSGTDTHDEASFDGIHITLGHVDRDDFSMCSSLALNNFREEMEPENCCLGVTRVVNKPVSSNKWMNFGDATRFNLSLSEDEVLALVDDDEVIESEWMPKVTYGGYQGKKGGRFSGGFFQNWNGWFGH